MRRFSQVGVFRMNIELDADIEAGWELILFFGW